MNYPPVLFLTLLLSFSSSLVCAQGPPGKNSSVFTGQPDKAQPTVKDVSSLSEAAQSVISAWLGQSDKSYRVRRERGGLHATNTEHLLAAQFTADGVELKTGKAYCLIALRGLGYGRRLSSVETAYPRSWLNRVEYRRGVLTEWYVNGLLGVEQGFTIDQPPGKSRGEALTLAMTFLGDLVPAEDSTPGSLVLNNQSGQSQLRYTGLSATDALGKSLAAWLELHGDRLLIRVKDSTAHYPITIDPWFQAAKLTARGGRIGDQFGLSVAVDGNVVVVGEVPYIYQGKGAAYVFVRPASGWKNTKQAAKLTASDPGNCTWYACNFGYSVAIQGNTIVVGAPASQTGGLPGTGAAYVFVKPSNGWKTTSKFNAKLLGSNETEASETGTSVAIDGHTIVAGAQTWSSVYVFVKPAGGWQGVINSVAQLTAADGSVQEDLGRSVSVSSDTVVGGAMNYPLGSGPGAAYVFVKPPGGWKSITQTATLTASDPKQHDSLGESAAISGNTIVAGAPGKNGKTGALYLFEKPTKGWKDMTQTARLTASDAQNYDQLGYSVAIRGSKVVAGAPGASVGNAVPGAAYLFVKPSSGWADMTETDKISSSDGQTNDIFGYSVALDGSTTVCGAPYAHFQNNNQGPGAAYVFEDR